MNELLTTFTAASLVALIYTLVNFAKHLMNLDLPESKNAVVTQLIVWLIAIGVLNLAAQADIAASIRLINNTPLSVLDEPSLILIGFSFGSAGSFLRDWLKAKDDTQTINTPQITRMERKLPPGVDE